MKYVLNLLVWLVFSPLLIKTSDRHWLIKTILILFSPFTFFIVIMLLLTVYYATVPCYDEFPVYHRFKSAKDIATVINADVPNCDTIGAQYYIVGNDYAVHEQFILKEKLGKRDMNYYKSKCQTEDLWKETDTTFVYKLSDPERKIIKEGYEYIEVSIYKTQKKMEVEYGCY